MKTAGCFYKVEYWRSADNFKINCRQSSAREPVRD